MSGSAEHARWLIASTWNGDAALPGETVVVDATLDDAVLVVIVDAPAHDDPPPPAPPGRLDGLWDFEVVELFLLGDDDRYLELELGPHGHWLALDLAGARRVVGRPAPIDFEAHREGARWRGRARVPASWLPPGLRRANAFAIHGRGPARRYLAAHPTGGEAPDFHRLASFAPIPWTSTPPADAER